ncbi:hypothetical protein AGMMS50267_06670 [Spirochaetia bacterium]|nr:hypothetical protein AGMMS50267_06670 [Spirochaetia bacterium]
MNQADSVVPGEFIPVFRAFLVHAWADTRKDRLYFTGRLEDGRSFAAMEAEWRPAFHVYERDLSRCGALLSSIKHEVLPPRLEAFSGKEKLVLLRFARYSGRLTAFNLLERAGIPSPDGSMKPAEAFLAQRFIRGPLEIRGAFRKGRLVDVVFPRAELVPSDGSAKITLKIASIDIETDTRDNSIRAVGISLAGSDFGFSGGLVRVLAAEPVPSNTAPVQHGLSSPGEPPPVDVEPRIIYHPDERSLLAAFTGDIQTMDPDVLTGWNFLDFDFPRLAERCERLGVPFMLGRSPDEAKYFAGSAGGSYAGGPGSRGGVSHNRNVVQSDHDNATDSYTTGYRDNADGSDAANTAAIDAANDSDTADDGGWSFRRRSATALVPGRQVIDALRIVRSGPRGGAVSFSGFTLETVSQAVLGEGKTVSSAGTDKIACLDRLYAVDPAAFGQYCYRDAELVLRILAKTGLFLLTMERAALTGVFLDKAWTSVVSFERIYGMELRKRGIAPPPPRAVSVSGAAGGTVLDPLPGFFPNVAVFDFRSLYPTIMRTFNIDPLARERAIAREWAIASERLSPPSDTRRFPAEKAQSFAEGTTEILRPAVETGELLPPITAPNGAAFSREPGVLPALIAEYFTARRKALDAGDDTAAHVYKILMNSFYGVLGTAACRYGRTELAGAITSFARKWLLLSRDWFTEKGYRVLYGDTDSLFVETGLGDGAVYDGFLEHCGALARCLNQFLTERIRTEYQLDSFIELRFEKAYRRFLVPPLRGIHNDGEIRGRAKGYGGYLLREDGGAEVEVKGMEAVRSDATPLARRFQLELLELVFTGNSNTTACNEITLKNKVLETLKELRTGKLDDELVYRKRLSRPPETYTSSTPPQVKAARALGWKGRRGTVEYVWTVNGPEPVSLPHAALDYDHYTDSQVLPVARSIAAALGWHTELFPQKGRSREALNDGQMELDL